MAFVPPLTSRSFSGSQLTSQTTCLAIHSIPHVARTRMCFSSIDDPATAVKLHDTSLQTKELVLRAAYKQVFGNAYLMDSERAELASVESDFKTGKLDVRDLVRAMGKSEEYRKRFFARSGPYRFVELNCKHFLGRGPRDQAEVSFHVQKLMKEGYHAEIDSYMDGDEFDMLFGGDTVPRFVFKGSYLKDDEFNRMMLMRKNWDGCSTSTVSGSTAPGKPIPAQLIMGEKDYVSGFGGVMKGLPAGFRPEPTRTSKLPPVPKNAQAGLRVRIKVAENLYQVFEIPPQLPRDEPKWKKERMGQKRWNGVWF